MHSQSTVASAFLEPEKCRPAASGELYSTRSTASCSRPSNNGSQGLSPSPQSAFPARKTQKKWTGVHEKYKTTALIGQGTYGIVYKGEKRGSPNKVVALKRARLDAFTDFGIPETALREVTILRDLKHENIMHVAEISCSTSRLYMVCEYLEMDLKKFIRSHNRAIPKQTVKHIAYQILKGLAFCHGHRVMHRDLKPHNILLSNDASKVKLADFGLARPKHAPSKTITHEVVTLWYRAPELLLGQCKYCDAIDIWSVGCIIAEMLSGKALFPGDSEVDTLFKIFRLFGTPTAEEWPSGAVDPISQFPVFARKTDPFSVHIDDLDEDAADILQKLLLFDPASRLTAMTALTHSWFDDVRPTPSPTCRNPSISSSSSGVLSPESSSQNGSVKSCQNVSSGQKKVAVRPVPGHISHGDSITTATSSATVRRDFSAAASSSSNSSSPSLMPADEIRAPCVATKPQQASQKNTALEMEPAIMTRTAVTGAFRRSESSPSDNWSSSAAPPTADGFGLSSTVGASAAIETAKNRGWWKWSRRQRSKTCTAVDEAAAAVAAAAAMRIRNPKGGLDSKNAASTSTSMLFSSSAELGAAEGSGEKNHVVGMMKPFDRQSSLGDGVGYAGQCRSTESDEMGRTKNFVTDYGVKHRHQDSEGVNDELTSCRPVEDRQERRRTVGTRAGENEGIISELDERKQEHRGDTGGGFAISSYRKNPVVEFKKCYVQNSGPLIVNQWGAEEVDRASQKGMLLHRGRRSMSMNGSTVEGVHLTGRRCESGSRQAAAMRGRRSVGGTTARSREERGTMFRMHDSVNDASSSYDGGGGRRIVPIGKTRRSEDGGRQDDVHEDEENVRLTLGGGGDCDSGHPPVAPDACSRRRLFSRCNLLRCFVGDLCRTGSGVRFGNKQEGFLGGAGRDGSVVSSSSSSSVPSSSTSGNSSSSGASSSASSSQGSLSSAGDATARNIPPCSAGSTRAVGRRGTTMRRGDEGNLLLLTTACGDCQEVVEVGDCEMPRVSEMSPASAMYATSSVLDVSLLS